jgi:galactokinase
LAGTANVDVLVAAFERLYARPPAGVWAAPGRVNVIGEHTDYNQGLVLPIAIDRRTLAAVAARDDRTVRVASRQRQGEPVARALSDLGPGRIRGWAAYPLGVAWALADGHGLSQGADILVDSRVPLGAGLSSSAALEAAVGLALTEVAGRDLARDALALACQRAENEVVGAPTGVMDQMASLLGRAGSALFLDCRSLQAEQVPFDLAAAGQALLVIDTRASHDLADGEYGDRRSACEEAAHRIGVPALRDATLESIESLSEPLRRRARHVVTENDRVQHAVRLLRRGNVAGLGPLLTASHASLRDDFEVSIPELDVVAATAVDAGALGARMVGGGFGGSVLALVPGDRVDAVTGAVEAAYEVRGWASPIPFVVTPADGARRLR